jgi:hypothetical protein
LSGTKIGDGALAHLAACDKLEELYLAETAVSDAGLAHLKPLVALRFLDLSGTQIADARLESLKELPALAVLNVDGTRVTAFDKLRSLPQTNPNVQKILAALDEKTQLDFTDQPLSDVIEYLKNRHEIEIRFDGKSVDKQGRFAPITARLEDITLRKAFAAILDPLNLTIGIRHEVLLIAAKPLPESALDVPEVPAGERISPRLANTLGRPVKERLFNGQPLREVIATIAKLHDVAIRFDESALTVLGADLDSPVSCRFKDISLKSALELILGDLDLTAVAEGDALVIRPQKAK